MVFSSFNFLVFFSALALIWMVIKPSWRLSWLTLGGIFFYGTFKPSFLIILFLVIVVNYFTGTQIQNRQRKIPWLYVAVAINLLLLIFYKYIDVLTSTFLSVSGASHVFFAGWLMPIGISYFTFQGIGYNFDIYYEIDEAEKNPWMLASYFIFFPKIAQGPVERPRNLLPQLREYKSFDYESAVAGLTLLAWGIFKKAVVADRLAMYVDPVYKNPHNFSGASLLATAPLYVFQLYCDFSGYTDMAWGISGFFGYKLIQNFNRPFVAISIADFWKRWHISFSTWLNEYLYNPLSVVLRSWKTMGVITAVMITFFISGVWHGAGWSFAAWGILNGIAMVFEILTLKWKKKIKKTTSPLLYKPVAWTVTMAFILFSFIVGRAITFDNAGYILSNMFSNLSVGIDFKMIGADVYNYIIGIVALLLVFYVEKFKEADGFRLQLLKLPVTVRWSLYIVLVLVVINLGVLGNNKFIYFQF